MVGFAFDLILFFYIPFSLLHVLIIISTILLCSIITLQFHIYIIKGCLAAGFSLDVSMCIMVILMEVTSFISHYSDYTAIMWSFPWSSVLLDRPPSDSQNNLYRMCRIVNSGLGGQIHLGCLFITLKCINLALIFIVTMTLNCLEMMV